MTLKLLKLKANDEISSGASETSSSGSLMAVKMRQGLAPSMRAASSTSSGSDCRAPVQTRNM